MGRVINSICDFVSVCACVRAVKAKCVELPTPNLVGMAVTLTLRSKVKVMRLPKPLPSGYTAQYSCLVF